MFELIISSTPESNLFWMTATTGGRACTHLTITLHAPYFLSNSVYLIKVRPLENKSSEIIASHPERLRFCSSMDTEPGCLSRCFLKTTKSDLIIRAKLSTL